MYCSLRTIPASTPILGIVTIDNEIVTTQSFSLLIKIEVYTLQMPRKTFDLFPNMIGQNCGLIWHLYCQNREMFFIETGLFRQKCLKVYSSFILQYLRKKEERIDMGIKIPCNKKRIKYKKKIMLLTLTMLEPS